MQNQDSTQNLTPVTNVFQMYDVKTQSFSFPLYWESFEAADKWFDTITNTHGCGVTHTNPEDFVVYHIGTYDIETGRTTYFEERQLYVSLGGLRRPCKACEEHAAKSQQHVDNFYSKGKQK